MIQLLAWCALCSAVLQDAPNAASWTDDPQFSRLMGGTEPDQAQPKKAESWATVGARFGEEYFKDVTGTFMEFYLDAPLDNGNWRGISRLGIVRATGDLDEFTGTYFAIGIGYDFPFKIESLATSLSLRLSACLMYQFNRDVATAKGNEAFIRLGAETPIATVDDSYGFGLTAELVYPSGRWEGSLLLGYNFMKAHDRLSAARPGGGPPIVVDETDDIGGYLIGFSAGLRF